LATVFVDLLKDFVCHHAFPIVFIQALHIKEEVSKLLLLNCAVTVCVYKFKNPLDLIFLLLHVGHLFKRQPFFKGILRSLRG
jgi:hypothetical protein